MAQTPVRLDDLDDPRLAPYRALKDRDVAREHGLFICEGEHLVRRLLASGLSTHSLLTAEHRVSSVQPLVGAETPIYVVPGSMLSHIVGYRFHLGMLACGVRPVTRSVTELLPATTLAVCPILHNQENLGLIVRTAAALGADGLLVGEAGADVYSRRVVRVSMGGVFTLAIAVSRDVAGDLTALRREHGFRCVATVLDEAVTPLIAYRRPPRVAVLFGAEPTGLDADAVARCDDRVTIPMRRGSDSLNVAVAAGIVLHHLLSERSGGA